MGELQDMCTRNLSSTLLHSHPAFHLLQTSSNATDASSLGYVILNLKLAILQPRYMLPWEALIRWTIPGAAGGIPQTSSGTQGGRTR